MGIVRKAMIVSAEGCGVYIAAEARNVNDLGVPKGMADLGVKGMDDLEET